MANTSSTPCSARAGWPRCGRRDHLMLDKPARIKLVKPELRLGELDAAADPREPQVGAAHRHPSIVRVSDFGQTEDGSAYLVMELLEGRSLARRADPRHGAIPTPSRRCGLCCR